MDQLREENAMLQRMLLELTAPQPAVRRELESLGTSSFIKAFYTTRVEKRAVELSELDEGSAVAAGNDWQQQQEETDELKTSSRPKITRTSANGQPPMFAAFPEEIREREQEMRHVKREKVHEDKVRELHWRHAGTSSKNDSKPALDKESLRLRPKGRDRSASPNPVSLLPRIARSAPPPTMGQFPSGTNRSLLVAPSSASPGGKRAAKPQKLAGAGRESPPAKAGRAQLPPPSSEELGVDFDDASFVVDSDARTEVDDYLAKLFGSSGAVPAATRPGTTASASTSPSRGRGGGLGELAGSWGGAALEEGAEEGAQTWGVLEERHSREENAMAAADAQPFSEETEAEAEAEAAPQGPRYTDWVIPPPPQASLPPDPSQLAPVSCELVEGMHRRPILVMLLASRRPAWKVDAVQQYDPDLLLAPFPAPPDRMVIKVTDPVDSHSASVNVNYRAMTTLLYDLIARHPTLEVSAHFFPSSLDWWRAHAKYTLVLKTRPDGTLMLSLSKLLVERLVVSLAAAVNIEGLAAVSNESDLSGWFCAPPAAAQRSSSPSSSSRRAAASSRKTQSKRSKRASKSRSRSRSPSSSKPASQQQQQQQPEQQEQEQQEEVVDLEESLGLEPLTLSIDAAETEAEDAHATASPSSPSALDGLKLPTAEIVARQAIKKGRETVSSSHKFRTRPLTDSELSLIHSPFAVPLVTAAMKREGERIRAKQMASH